MKPNSTNTGWGSEDWSKEFDEKFVDKQLNGEWWQTDYDYPITITPTKIKSFIRQLLLTERKKWEMKLERGIGKTFRGSASGLHGYQVLPDCKKEKHNTKECADCFMDTFIEEKKK